MNRFWLPFSELVEIFSRKPLKSFDLTWKSKSNYLWPLSKERSEVTSHLILSKVKSQRSEVKGWGSNIKGHRSIYNWFDLTRNSEVTSHWSGPEVRIKRSEVTNSVGPSWPNLEFFWDHPDLVLTRSHKSLFRARGKSQKVRSHKFSGTILT